MQQQKKNKGFTIIEVLIVLAIAGLIMLIVFLAVPALQRNSRNSSRQSDASLLANAINDCLTNNNGRVANCQAIGANNVQFDSANAGQLTTAPAYSAAVATGGTAQARWIFSATCNGSQAQLGGNARQFVVVWQQEGATGNQNRCLAS